jgi:hypothetical protein
MGTPGGLSGNVFLARTAAGPLAGDHRAALEDLAAPDAPWLLASKGTGEALGADWAINAEHLGPLEVGRSVGEPQVGVVARPAWKVQTSRWRGVEQVADAGPRWTEQVGWSPTGERDSGGRHYVLLLLSLRF